MLHLSLFLIFTVLFLQVTGFFKIAFAQFFERVIKSNINRFQPNSRIFNEKDYQFLPGRQNCIADALDINPYRWNINNAWPALENKINTERSSRYKRRKELRKAFKLNGFQEVTLGNLFFPPASRKLTFGVYSYNKQRNSSFIHIFWLDGEGKWISKPGDHKVVNLGKVNLVRKFSEINGIKADFLGLYWADMQTNELKLKLYNEAIKANALIGLPAPPF